ncbi:Temptin [Paragonimus heterotremus]|uniref:Temptin n=1 Tax=Paragonimus heterotremus TaxID=100268 RepID=A0A8J4T5P8_9TREM|nr:Temptin [Paragonimus heterotremus]
MKFLLALFVFASLHHQTYSYGNYREHIPNGHKVEHPCKPGEIIGGVGHVDMSGGGRRNNFGLDFARYRTWDKLCPLDSDRDGFTNGEELGDPRCVWKMGAEPERADHITHPGVCTPFDSEICRLQNICGVSPTT